MSDSDPTMTACTAICHTDGCPLNGEPRTVMCSPNPVPPTYRATCAQCGQPITDITPVAAAG